MLYHYYRLKAFTIYFIEYIACYLCFLLTLADGRAFSQHYWNFNAKNCVFLTIYHIVFLGLKKKENYLSDKILVFILSPNHGGPLSLFLHTSFPITHFSQTVFS